MQKEVELKLEVTPDALRRLEESTWVRLLPPAKVEELVSVYFDTSKHELRKRNVSLRVRRADGQSLQTLKKLGAGLARTEVETAITGDRPKLGRRGARLLGADAAKLEKKLVPVFETSVKRRSLPIELQGVVVELAIDEGEIRAGGRSEPIHELELELKGGEPEKLVDVAKRLMQEVPVRYGARSKAERGYALSEERGVEAAHAEPVELDADATLGDAFRLCGLASLRQITLNEEGVKARDAEAVHQMRVGLRRLRAAMSIFKQLLGDPESDRIKAELEWLTEELGPARDVDVLVNETPALAREAELHGAEVGHLSAVLDERRRAGFERAAAAVGSDRHRTLVLDTALWLSGGTWATTEDDLVRMRREARIRPFARRVLRQRERKVEKRLAKLPKLDTRGRHRLRIFVKKLRYATNFFASLFPKGDAERDAFEKVLSKLQDTLGSLNDAVVHERIAREMTTGQDGGSREGREATFAIGLVCGQEDAEGEELLAQASRARRRLKAAPSFWQ